MFWTINQERFWPLRGNVFDQKQVRAMGQPLVKVGYFPQHSLGVRIAFNNSGMEAERSGT